MSSNDSQQAHRKPTPFTGGSFTKQSNSIQMLKMEQKVQYSFERKEKMIQAPYCLILSRPEKTSLIYSERNCPAYNHTIKMVRLFTSTFDTCPIHGSELEKSITSETLEAYHFYTENLKKDKLHIFISAEDRDRLKLDIYDKVAVEGYLLKIPSGKAQANEGIYCTSINEFIEPIENQTSMLSKQDVIEQFGLDLPSLSLSKKDFDNYKHALLLSAVHVGLTQIVVGDPGLCKTEYGFSLKELVDTAYVDSNLASDAGLIGMAVRDSQGFFFSAGAIFSARNSLLICDEIDNMIRKNPAFLKKLNNIQGNQRISFRKGNINFEDDFNMSMVAFANPIYGRFQTIPHNQIKQTFRENPEMLSRCHFIWALSCRTNPNTIREYDKKAIRIYIQQARRFKVSEKDITPEAKSAIIELYKKNINDSRGHKKITDLCIAEAKFSFHKTVNVEDVRSIAQIYETQNKLLSSR